MKEIVKNSVESILQKITDVLKSENPSFQFAQVLNLEEIIEGSIEFFINLNIMYKPEKLYFENFKLLFLKLLNLLEILLLIVGMYKITLRAK